VAQELRRAPGRQRHPPAPAGMSRTTMRQCSVIRNCCGRAKDGGRRKAVAANLDARPRRIASRSEMS
jgi:hypothetical protein